MLLNSRLSKKAGSHARCIFLGMEMAGISAADAQVQECPGQEPALREMITLAMIGLDGRWMFAALVNDEGRMPVDRMSELQQRRHSAIVGTRFVRYDDLGRLALDWALEGQKNEVAANDPRRSILLVVPDEPRWREPLEVLVAAMKDAARADGLELAVEVFVHARPAVRRMGRFHALAGKRGQPGPELREHAFLRTMALVVAGMEEGDYNLLPLRDTDFLNLLVGRRSALALHVMMERLIGRPAGLPMYMDLSQAFRAQAGG